MTADKSVVAVFPAGHLVELELCCCCCGNRLDTLLTPWLVVLVRPVTIFTREPCEACEVELARS